MTITRRKMAKLRTLYWVGKQPAAVKAAPTGEFVVLKNAAAIGAVMLGGPARRADWVLSDTSLGTFLLRDAVEHIRPVGKSRPRLGHLLVISKAQHEQLHEQLIPPAQGIFSSVHYSPFANWLPSAELLEVLRLPDRENYFVGGMADQVTGLATFYRGDLSQVSIPLSFLEPTAAGLRPDPKDVEIIDNGLAVRMGKYEATTDSILYDVDPSFRQRVKRHRRQEDDSFGACLRRLRIHRGVRQNDFPSLTAKTISRIESGEIEKPHQVTLEAIAARLGIKADTISSY